MKHFQKEIHRAAMETAILHPSVIDRERQKSEWTARFRKQTGYWILYKDGERWRTTGTTDKDEAQALLDLHNLQEDARAERIVDCRRAEVTAVIDHGIMTAKVQKKRGAKSVISVLNGLKKHVEGRQLRDLDVNWLAEMEEAMRADGYAYASVVNAVNYLRIAIRGYCKFHDREAVLNFPTLPPAEPRMRVVSHAEQAKILRWATGSEAYDPATDTWTPQNWLSDAERLKRLVTYRTSYLGAMFGSRAGVYVGLSYGPRADGGGYFDLENGVFHRVAPGTKTSFNKRSPPVDMPPEAVAEIAHWRDMDGGCPWVFPTLDRRAMGQGRMQVIYAEAMDRLGIEGMFAHVWRHTLITRLIEVRPPVSVFSIAAIVGVSVKVLGSVYSHHDAGAVQQLAHAAMGGMIAPPARPSQMPAAPPVPRAAA